MNPPAIINTHLINRATLGKTARSRTVVIGRRQTYVVFRLFSLILITAIFSTSILAELPLWAQDAQTFSIFLPLVSSADRGYQLNQRELEIEQLLLTDPGQQRTQLTFNPLLAGLARQKAEDMANRKYVDHTTPDGYGPNYLASQAGYRLPSNYSTELTGNNIESLAAGYNTIPAVWKAWMESNGHRSHILGEHEFYRQQTEYGIGYFASPTSPYRHYWVILIATPEK